MVDGLRSLWEFVSRRVTNVVLHGTERTGCLAAVSQNAGCVVRLVPAHPVFLLQKGSTRWVEWQSLPPL